MFFKKVSLMLLGKCTACGNNIVAGSNYAKFKCPACGEEEIVRCNNCKTTANKYECKKCGFIGP